MNNTLKLINLTNHEIVFDSRLMPTIPPSGKIARVYFEQMLDHHVGTYPVYREVNGWIKGLGKPRPGIGYIVSGIVFQNTLREDVYTPNTQPWSATHGTHGTVRRVKSLLCHPRVIA